MFDFRYHALSLVAVFLALTIGLLLGVAIGDEGLVSSAERDVRDSLRGDVTRARRDAARLRGELRDQEELTGRLYPLIAGGRLAGQRIGLIALGDVPDSTVDDVREALAPTGGRLVTVAVIRVPIDGKAISRRLSRTPYETLAAADPRLLERFGRRIGLDFVRGGETLDRVSRQLFSSLSGDHDGVTSVVLARGGEEGGKATAAFEDGLVRGLTRDDTTVVGVEQTDTEPSQVEWYEDHDLTSVDNVDQVPGKAALVFALAGAEGTFGVKSTADSLLPRAANAPVGP